MAFTTRKPTGKPPWPMILLAGMEKAGKTYAAAQASASEHIGRTFWISVGEDDPDEYGAIKGARFEIVEHDGTYRGVLNAILAASREPAEPGKPNMIVVDSIGRMWELLSDMAQADANRKRRKDEATITMDQWNLAKQRWQHVIIALKEHPGPVVLTSRMEQVAVVVDGNPTGEKTWRIKAEKSLVFDVTATVEMRTRGEYLLTGVRSLRFQFDPGVTVPYPDFTVEKLWRDLRVVGDGAQVGARHITHIDGESSLSREERRQSPEVQKARAAVLNHHRGDAGVALDAARAAGFDLAEPDELLQYAARLPRQPQQPAPRDYPEDDPATEKSDAEWRNEYREDNR